ncbi:uncharacterized protein LOC128149657 [Harpia harpyja]|uniref:uncharacterized protein LOC128149657 n=1 Tax=Harpia harpyja TaxID=202280 RepID=UPI0022B1AB6E|nr:uncharacterized protein LOC128149657 [Harpia harpyja]
MTCRGFYLLVLTDPDVALLPKESPFRHESCLQGELHGPAGEVQRGSRSCGPSFSFLAEKSGAGWLVARGQMLPLAPSDNELSRRRATSRSSNCKVMNRTLSCPMFLPVDEDEHNEDGWCLQHPSLKLSPHSTGAVQRRSQPSITVCLHFTHIDVKMLNDRIQSSSCLRPARIMSQIIMTAMIHQLMKWPIISAAKSASWCEQWFECLGFY